MGIGGISIWQLLIVLAIVVMVFGTKRLRNLGGDLGSAIKGFRSAMREGDRENGGGDEGERGDEPRVIEQAEEPESDTASPEDADRRQRRDERR